MQDAEALTAANPGLGLMVAVAYGGRWDITQACRSLAADVAAGKLAASPISARSRSARVLRSPVFRIRIC